MTSQTWKMQDWEHHGFFCQSSRKPLKSGNMWPFHAGVKEKPRFQTVETSGCWRCNWLREGPIRKATADGVVLAQERSYVMWQVVEMEGKDYPSLLELRWFHYDSRFLIRSCRTGVYAAGSLSWSDHSLLRSHYSGLEWECLFCTIIYWKHLVCFWFFFIIQLRDHAVFQMKLRFRTFKQSWNS